MANATAVLVYETALPIAFTVADGDSIEKGDFLQLTDPMTVSLSSGAHNLFGGIAAEEKIASDGKTKIAVYREGIFRVEAGTSGVTVGKQVVIEAKNELTDYTTLDGEKGETFGYTFETAANGEFFMMELRA